jgi:hypothetical protein
VIFDIGIARLMLFEMKNAVGFAPAAFDMH